MNIIGIILSLALLTTLFLFGVIKFYKNLSFLKKAKVIKGVVIDITLTENSEGFFKVPVVEYYDNEEHKSFIFKSGIQNIKYKIGDEIEIRLLKDDSTRICEVNRPFMLLMGPSIPLIMGLSGLIIIFLRSLGYV